MQKPPTRASPAAPGAGALPIPLRSLRSFAASFGLTADDADDADKQEFGNEIRFIIREIRAIRGSIDRGFSAGRDARLQAGRMPAATEKKAERQLRPTGMRAIKKPRIAPGHFELQINYWRRRNISIAKPPKPANTNYNMTSTAGWEIRRSKVASFI